MRCRQSGCDVDFLLKDLKEHEEEVRLLFPSLPLLVHTLSSLIPPAPLPIFPHVTNSLLVDSAIVTPVPASMFRKDVVTKLPSRTRKSTR
jgi:hypothetical protein